MIKTTIQLIPNREKIINYFLENQNKEIHTTEIEKELKLPHTTVIDNLQMLEKHQIIEKIIKKSNSKRGRPKTFWRLY